MDIELKEHSIMYWNNKEENKVGYFLDKDTKINKVFICSKTDDGIEPLHELSSEIKALRHKNILTKRYDLENFIIGLKDFEYNSNFNVNSLKSQYDMEKKVFYLAVDDFKYIYVKGKKVISFEALHQVENKKRGRRLQVYLTSEAYSDIISDKEDAKDFLEKIKNNKVKEVHKIVNFLFNSDFIEVKLKE